MTIGPTERRHRPRPTRAFALTRALVDDLGLDECSMGMSGDYELAVACGSTQVRIGTILFGPRPPPDPDIAPPTHSRFAADTMTVGRHVSATDGWPRNLWQTTTTVRRRGDCSKPGLRSPSLGRATRATRFGHQASSRAPASGGDDLGGR